MDKPVSEATLNKRDSLLDALTARVRNTGATPLWCASAPGRVNLIGDHTDYSGGLALPLAIDYYTTAVATPGPETRASIRIHSEAQGHCEFACREPSRGGDWSDYLRGVVAGYSRRGVAIPALDVWIGGDLPLGAGLSSSASLELCFAALLEAVSGQSLAPKERALLCQKAEHDYPGMPCGILDQFAITFAEANAALLLDCQDQTTSPVALPSRARLAVVNSGVSHALVDGAYGKRRDEVAAAEKALGNSLRNCSLDDVEELREPDLQRRARHVISENQRVRSFIAALDNGFLETAGKIMNDSHRSLAMDFAVSCPEMDLLVEAAQGAGARGARMTGGGFGGSMVALVKADDCDRFQSKLSAWFLEVFKRPLELRWVEAVAGAQGGTCP